jgi:dTDP-glucose 4,6-dehydratase/UDP-glucose 4-epimerase
MKILVIGAKGFIGLKVCEFFSQMNWDIYQADVQSDTDKNYFQIKDNDDFYSLFQISEFDLCINASGSGSVQYSYDNLNNDFILNVVNVFFILDAIRQYNKGCKFINISSAAVYGNTRNNPIKEIDILNPISPYGFHKKISEDICKEFYDIYKIKTCSLRAFSIYGEGLKKQLFWDIFQKSINSKVIKLSGTGNETRDFIYIYDFLKALYIIVLNAKFIGETINVGSSKQISIKEAATIFLEYLGKDLKIEFSNINIEGYPLHWEADISILKSYGFSPQYSLKDGLLKYYQWIKNL